jgi:hypothetical protein
MLVSALRCKIKHHCGQPVDIGLAATEAESFSLRGACLGLFGKIAAEQTSHTRIDLPAHCVVPTAKGAQR